MKIMMPERKREFNRVFSVSREKHIQEKSKEFKKKEEAVIAADERFGSETRRVQKQNM